jgi:hypothetical protein
LLESGAIRTSMPCSPVLAEAEQRLDEKKAVEDHEASQEPAPQLELDEQRAGVRERSCAMAARGPPGAG